MTPREFFDFILNQVKELSIFFIFDRYGFYYEPTSRIYKYVDCPFCGATTKDKKSNIHGRHNGFICYKCTEEPLSHISFIMKRFNLDFKSAVFDIAITVGITTSIEVDEYYKAIESKRELRKKDFVYQIPENCKVSEIEAKPIASDDVLDKVFRIFRQGNSLLIGGEKLSKEHLNYLKGRNLSDEDIKNGKYFTIPSNKITPAIIQVLKKKYNIDEDVLENVPGFYRNSDEKITFKYYDAIGIPIINARMMCKGIQIRLNKEIVYTKSSGKTAKLRYIWLSSEDTPDGCSNGVGPGAPIDVTYPDTPRDTWSKNIFITEGKFKAQQLSKFTNAIVISVQGVGNWREIIKEIIDIQILTNNLIERIFVAYDADIAYKPQVNMHATNMSNSLVEEFPNLPVFYCIWNPDNGKGIDDLIFNNKTNTIKTVQKKIYDKLYSLIVKNFNELDIDFNKLEDEVKLKIFLDCIYSRI